MRGQATPEAKPSSSGSVPESPSGIDALKDQVRYVLYKNPLKTIRYFEDDPKRLETWTRARWEELTRDEQPEGLAVAFRAVAQEFAYIAGYSVRSVQEAGIDDALSESMPGYKTPKPSRPCNSKPRPYEGARRKRYHDTGDKPPGT